MSSLSRRMSSRSLSEFPTRLRGNPRTDPSVVERPLTPRQRDIMALTADGLTAQEIGEALGIAMNTVRTHREKALRRLPARNTTHAVAILLRRGDIL